MHGKEIIPINPGSKVGYDVASDISSTLDIVSGCPNVTGNKCHSGSIVK
jgi:hypothetical protein